MNGEYKAELRHQAEVMLACADGNKIEWKTKASNNWQIKNTPEWNWYKFDYRIAEKQPKKMVIQTFIGENGWVISRTLGSDSWKEYTNSDEWTHIQELDKEVTVYD